MSSKPCALALSFLFFASASATGQGVVTALDARLAAGLATAAQADYLHSGGDPKILSSLIDEGQKVAARDPVAAYRAFTHALVIASHAPWTAEAELATALDVVLTAGMFERDRPISGRISFLFAGPAAGKPPYRVKLDVVSPEGRLEAPGPRVSIGDPARSTAGSAFEFRLATGPLRPGSHILRAVLENRDGKAIFTYRRPFLALGAPAEALAVLEKQAAALGRDHALCATTAQYMVESARRATKSYGTVPFGTVVAYVFAGLYQSFVDMGWMRAAKPADPRAALARAGELIRAAQSGTDILLGMAGDIRMAYRSAVDNELVPFRVYVPSTYDRRRPAPLLVTLHGSGSDENSFFDGYNGRWIAQAEKHGYVLVSPNGRGPTSGFTVASNGQQDVLDVVALVRGRYNIDSARIFLTGHSMGGSGTVRIGARHPQLFAALAPIAGMPAEDETWKALDASRKIPMLVIAGGQDTTVPAAGCRAAAERAKALGHPVEYLEYPDADHMRVGEVAADAVFEFFNRPRRPTT